MPDTTRCDDTVEDLRAQLARAIQQQDELQAKLAEARDDRERLMAMVARIEADAAERIETEIEHREQFNDALLQAQSDLGEGCVVVDGQRVKFANEALCRLTGYTLEELQSFSSFFELFPPDDRDRHLDRMRQRLTGGLVDDHYEVAFHHKQGHLLYAEIAVKVITLGQSPRIICLAREITARKEAERALKEQFHHLKELDRVKNAFVGMVSHELRTPLTTIQGYAEFLDEGIGGGLTSRQREFVVQIVEAGKRLQSLVDDLLDFARLDAGTFKLTRQDEDLNQRVHEVLGSLYPQAEAMAIRLEASLPEGPLTVCMDAGRIVQVLTNLMGNALKFTEAGGRISVSVQHSSDQVRVTVADTGIGIAPEHRSHLFDRFYQVDPTNTRKRGGTGLGLSICQALVQAHGGEVGVESELGEGSTFWFVLPLAGTAEAS